MLLACIVKRCLGDCADAVIIGHLAHVKTVTLTVVGLDGLCLRQSLLICRVAGRDVYLHSVVTMAESIAPVLLVDIIRLRLKLLFNDYVLLVLTLVYSILGDLHVIGFL